MTSGAAGTADVGDTGDTDPATTRLGVVAIGRNEGERLRRCLASLTGTVGRSPRIVYVDSGSTDGSVTLAAQMGALVVELDRSVAFSAARARNAGFAKLIEGAPEVELVQFVDGDCEVASGWLERARQEISTDPQLAVVCGRRRERHPEASIYNRLCDLEWNTPIGLADSCGGDALMRVKAFREVDGFDATVIAGEEPDLCLRLRRRGWKILRIDAEMTLHDAAMTRLSQWWKRSLRSGHAYAEGAARHGREPERHWVQETRSNWFWGLLVPTAAVVLLVPSAGLSVLFLGGHLVLAARVYRWRRRNGTGAADARLDAFFCALGKVPQGLGQLLYWTKRLTGRRAAIIEYKKPGPDETT